ncbi:MAG TPA: hypothetical protein PLV08_15965, partial [Flavobacteriales bacterium]|nr:hypothetical protein [Flavobacteriales bacterium]
RHIAATVLWSRLAMTEARMESLKGQFLVAMPGMGDERFRDTVIYIVAIRTPVLRKMMVNPIIPTNSNCRVLIARSDACDTTGR